MGKVEDYSEIIKNVLREYEKIVLSNGQIKFETVFDDVQHRYLLIIIGRDNKRRVHGCHIHVDIIDGKFWINRDGTEEGVATNLLENGVPKEHIVLAFKSPEMRKYTEFAVC